MRLKFLLLAFFSLFWFLFPLNTFAYCTVGFISVSCSSKSCIQVQKKAGVGNLRFGSCTRCKTSLSSSGFLPRLMGTMLACSPIACQNDALHRGDWITIQEQADDMKVEYSGCSVEAKPGESYSKLCSDVLNQKPC